MQEEFQNLANSMKEPLPSNINQREELRQDIALAESYGVIIARQKRTLLQQLEEQESIALLELKQDEAYSKMNAEEKKIMLKSKVTKIHANYEFFDRLEELIKRRCSVGQSLLNSISVEVQSGWNK